MSRTPDVLRRPLPGITVALVSVAAATALIHVPKPVRPNELAVVVAALAGRTEGS